MTRTRAQRRHHQAKADRKARAITHHRGLPDRWHRLRHNRRICSCFLCSGHRLEPDRQTLRAAAREVEQDEAVTYL